MEPGPARPARRAGRPPAFDSAALDHYAKMFAECRRHGLEPVVTLHHFVHPAWLGSDPWLQPETPEIFAAYVRHAVAHVNDRLTGEHRTAPLKYFITITSRTCWCSTPTGEPVSRQGRIWVPHDDARVQRPPHSHVRAYNAIHDLYAAENRAAPLVTINNYCSDLYWSTSSCSTCSPSRREKFPATA